MRVGRFKAAKVVLTSVVTDRILCQLVHLDLVTVAGKQKQEPVVIDSVGWVVVSQTT